MNPCGMPIKEAAALQVKLSKRIILSGPPHRINSIAATDVAYDMDECTALCAVAVFSYPELDEYYLCPQQNNLSIHSGITFIQGGAPGN